MKFVQALTFLALFVGVSAHADGSTCTAASNGTRQVAEQTAQRTLPSGSTNTNSGSSSTSR